MSSSNVHYFRVDDATKYGIDKAVILQNLRFWLDHVRANERNLFEGHYWVYNSGKALSELFPYLKATKIARLLRELEEDCAIMTGNYNESAYDRTKWYSMPEYSIVQNRTMDDPDFDNQMSKSEHSSPDNNPDSKSVLKDIGASDDAPTEKATGYHPEFEKAWKLYPKREGSNPKNKAYSCWKARTHAGVTAMTLEVGVRRYLSYCQARGIVGTGFVMQASRFFGTGEEYLNAWTVTGSTNQRPAGAAPLPTSFEGTETPDDSVPDFLK